MTRAEALIALLAQPDESGLKRHGYRRTQAGRGDPELIKRALGVAHVTWLRQEHTGGDISCVVSHPRRTIWMVRKVRP